MNVVTAITVVIALALPLLLLGAAVLGSKRKRERLRRQTATGSATVVAMQRTSTRVGHQPIVRVRMRLSFGESAQQREVELKIAVHPLDDDRVQVGTVFPLRFEPGNAADFSLELGGATGVELSDLHDGGGLHGTPLEGQKL